MSLSGSLLLIGFLAVGPALLPEASHSANLTVDGSRSFQTIDGMGVNLNVHGWDSAPFPEVIDLLVDQNGTSLVRVIRDPMDWVSRPSQIPALHALDPDTLAQVYETPAMRDIWGTIAYLNQKGVRGPQILLNFMGWTPEWMGGSGQFGVVSRIDPGMEGEFATMVASLVYYGRRVKNLDFLLLSPVNEHDLDGIEGPEIEPTQFRNVLQALVAELDHMGLTEIRLVAPDTAGDPGTYLSGIINSPTVTARVDHLAFHRYDSAASPGPSYAGKNWWMTETAAWCQGCDTNGPPSMGEWGFASKTADIVLGHLANGFAAVLLYEAHDSFYYHHDSYSTWGLVARDGGTYAARKRLFVNAQFNRFIRPGATRIAVDDAVSGLGTVLAFQDTSAGTLSIVGHVTSSTSVTIQGALTNLPFAVPFLRRYQTNAAANLERGADVPVSGGAFSLTIPGDTFFSLVWGENTAPAASILAPVDSGFYYPGQTIELSAGGADAESPPEALTYRWAVDLVSADGAVTSWASLTGPTVSYASPGPSQSIGRRQRIRLTAEDPGGWVSDTTEVTLWPEVDLGISLLKVTPDPAWFGQPASCTFRLSNAGRAPAPPSRWVIRAGSAVLAVGDMAVTAQGRVDMVVPITFTEAGILPLRVTVDSLDGLFETDEANNAVMRTQAVSPVPGNVPPVAVVEAAPVAGPAPLTTAFSGAASADADGDSLTFDWAFGDGRAGVGRRVSHIYAVPGDYVATLTVHDGRGSTDTAAVAISVGAPAFPRTPVLDDFDRADGALSTPPWADQNDRFTVSGGALATGTGERFTQWSAATFGPDQEAFVTFSVVDFSGFEHNLMLKIQGSTWNTGHVEVSYDAQGSRLAFRTFTPPSTWQEVGAIAGVAFDVGEQFGARVRADGSVRAYRNGAEIGSASIANWPFVSNGGRIGLSVSGAPGARFEDFGGGSIDPEATEPLAAPDVPRAAPRLSAAFPNPTSGGAVWSLWLPAADAVSFGIVDLQGREVWRSPSRTYGAGSWTLRWDAGAVPAGLYFARVRVGARTLLRRIAVLR